MEALTPQSEGFQAFKRSLARIFHSNGTVVGAGFAIAPGYLITCAHVVTAALNLPADSQDSPQQPIELEFLLAAQGERVTGQVVAWLPYKVAIDAPSLANPRRYRDSQTRSHPRDPNPSHRRGGGLGTSVPHFRFPNRRSRGNLGLRGAARANGERLGVD